MATYCTQSDIEAEVGAPDLIAFTDDENTGTINTTILNNLIVNASNYIDGKVGNIYAVPFGNPVPPVIQSMCVTIVCYRLYRRRLAAQENNTFEDDYNDVREILNKVNIGEQHLDLTTPRNYPQGAVVSRPTTYGGGPLGGGLANTM